MTYRILYTEEAARRIGRLDKSVKERVARAVVKISEHPEMGKRLTGLLSQDFSVIAGRTVSVTGAFSTR